MKISKAILFAGALCAATFTATSAPVIVGHSGLQGVSLSGSDVEAVLLGKSVTLNGARVVLVLAKSGSSQESYLKSSIGKTDDQFKNHWRRLFMTGGGSAPKEVADESAVVAQVAATPGAIGIVDESLAGDLPVIGR